MKKELINDILIYEKIKREEEKQYQPLQLEIPHYEETYIPVKKEEVKEPRRRLQKNIIEAILISKTYYKKVVLVFLKL